MKRSEKIQINELTWNPLQSETAILDKICITFFEGGFYGILGPNGSGKTSLMRHILRLIEAKSGQLLYKGQSMNSIKRKELAQSIALVPQNTNIETTFTAYDIVMMGRAPYQKRFQADSQEDIQIVKDAMELTHCYELKDQLFINLSGGEAQRVVTARAIAQQTPWLVLDEPIAHLDIRYQVELMNHLSMLNNTRDVSILAVLHDINLAASHCKQIVLMKKGRIVAAGPTEEVLTVHNLKQVYDMEFEMVCIPSTNRKYFIPMEL